MGDGTARVGASVPYADLVRDRARQDLDLPGLALPQSPAHIPDSVSLREAFAGSRRLVVIGAGWIGLEVAEAAAGRARRRC